MSERISDPLKAAARKTLENLSMLTFQQKQLIESGELTSVLQQIRRKRLVLTAIISAFTLLCGYFVLRSAASGAFSWPSVGGVSVLSWWLYSRLSRERTALKCVRQYTQASISAGLPTSILTTELRLNYRLSYDQHQLLKGGKTIDVATGIAATRRRNGHTLLRGIAPVCVCLFILDLLQGHSANTPDRMAMYDFMGILVLCFIITLGGLIFGLRELGIASALERKISAENA